MEQKDRNDRREEQRTRRENNIELKSPSSSFNFNFGNLPIELYLVGVGHLVHMLKHVHLGVRLYVIFPRSLRPIR